MLDIFKKWIDDYFADEEALILLLLLFVGFTVVLTMGDVVGPVIASLILAFLLQGMISRLTRWKVPRPVALVITILFFMGVALATLLVVLPLAWGQLKILFGELPKMLTKGQELLMLLPEQYPAFFSEEQVQEIIALASTRAGELGQWVVSLSLSTIPNILGLMLYLILVPILAFFVLADEGQFFRTLAGMLPTERPLMTTVWKEMNVQIANYIRGKVVEIVVVGAVTYVAFVALGLQYAALLAILVGLSVVVPYIGATVVTIPVALIAYFQWGTDSQFVYTMIAYMIIQGLDGNVLVPLLFSEAVNLSPIVIMIAVITFGGLWGIWGVFFAIPLATLVKAVYNAWPTRSIDVPGADLSSAEAG
ncbi:MAG: AI-2E family transporter [Pseudomonadales bacterium]